MIVVVRWLIIGLPHHINFGAPKARSSVHMTTNMQVKRLRLSARRAPCPEACTLDEDLSATSDRPDLTRDSDVVA